jgi:hypothetical protein
MSSNGASIRDHPEYTSDSKNMVMPVYYLGSKKLNLTFNYDKNIYPWASFMYLRPTQIHGKQSYSSLVARRERERGGEREQAASSLKRHG